MSGQHNNSQFDAANGQVMRSGIKKSLRIILILIYIAIPILILASGEIVRLAYRDVDPVNYWLLLITSLFDFPILGLFCCVFPFIPLGLFMYGAIEYLFSRRPFWTSLILLLLYAGGWMTVWHSGAWMYSASEIDTLTIENYHYRLMSLTENDMDIPRSRLNLYECAGLSCRLVGTASNYYWGAEDIQLVLETVTDGYWVIARPNNASQLISVRVPIDDKPEP
ncbi:MAG: hypothetical protein SF123_11065 [Chloroflexota bacterium]|nr:hypothetical protein [Chloroflexota bacterium]